MSTKKTAYSREELKAMFIKYFKELNGPGDYFTIIEYLESKNVELPEPEKRGRNIGSILGTLTETRVLEKIMVNEEHYRQLLNREPKGEKDNQGCFKVYVHTEYKSVIEKIKKQQAELTVRAEISEGLEPIGEKVLSHRLLEVVSSYGMKKQFLSVVLLKRLENAEKEANKIVSEGREKARMMLTDYERGIEDLATDITKRLYDLFGPLIEELNKQTEEVNAMRNELGNARSSVTEQVNKIEEMKKLTTNSKS